MLTAGLINERPIPLLGLKMMLRQYFQDIKFHLSENLSDFLNPGDHRINNTIIVGINNDNKLGCVNFRDQNLISTTKIWGAGHRH